MMRPFARATKAGARSKSEARQRRNVELNHLVEVVWIRLEQLTGCGDTRVVDQSGDRGVGSKPVGNPLHIGGNGQIGLQRLDLTATRRLNLPCQLR